MKNLTARSVIGFSIFPQEFERGVCSCHYLVAEYSVYPFITVHSMPDEAQPNCELSLVQTPKKLEFSDLSTLHFSCDGSVAVVVETFSGKPEYHVWEPGSGIVTAVHLAAMGRGFKFRAIGQLYSILGGVYIMKNLTARSVIGFSIFPQEFERGVCSCHYLVAEYSVYPFITVHSMPDEAQPNCELSLVQTPKKLEFSDLSTLHFSCDGSVAVVVETFSGKPEYHVWEPGSGIVTAVHLAAMGRGFKFRAIGQLYSILGGVHYEKSYCT